MDKNNILKPVSLFINDEMDMLRVRKQGESLAVAMGFKEIERAEIEIAIGEMASNIVKYSRAGGEMELIPVQGKSMKIVSRNVPEKEIKTIDLEKFLEDGFSTSGSLGIGLPGIRRLMDEFGAHVEPDGRIVITALKYRQAAPRGRVRYSVMNFPSQGESLSGDAFFIKSMPTYFFWSVIDALGHGPGASVTALKALGVIENNFTKSLPWIVLRCHDALERERGAAICLGRIDFLKSTIEYISVGNVETRIYKNTGVHQLHCLNGTVGIAIPGLDTITAPWHPGCCMVTFTDGISNKFKIGNQELDLSPQELAHRIITGWRKDYDDSTVMVVR
ncbi:MAG: SpoIIE family protein phosphatase [Desulfamplus sp.]|nr:SpoIIE family protein phosphatase [Desulfamplus sp.]